jgi:hypothetical protein
MDFVERIFGFAPDNGDGSFETYLILFAASVVVAGLLSTKRGRAFLKRIRHADHDGNQT